MLNENRSHKQHCLKGKEAGRNIMAKIVAQFFNTTVWSIVFEKKIALPTINCALYNKKTECSKI